MLKFFRLPFATTGDKTAVPDAVDSNGNVSYSQGYGFDYQRQKTDPAAKNIERDKMNQILFDITTAIAEIQSQGIPDFITSALNGGTAYSYGQNALVRYSGDIYVSLVAANTATPADLTKWALVPTPARLQSALNTRATAAGTADALTATFTPAIAALPAAPNTLSLMVRAGAANTTTTPTFSPDGLTAKTIVKGNNLPLVAGDIAGAGHWLELQYDATLDKWILQNPANGIIPAVPVGTVIHVSQNAAPSGYLKANGAAVSRSAYAVLFAVIGTTYGVGDGSTTFNLPDFRGEFLRGWDDSRGVDSGRVLGSSQKGTVHSFDAGPSGAVLGDRTGSTGIGGVGHADLALDYDANVTTNYPNAIQGNTVASAVFANVANTAEVGAGIVRPRNIALLACIKF